MLPRSFSDSGFVSSAEARKRRFLPGLKRPGIMIGSEGESNTGKTEFMMSCPGPGMALAVDRGYDACLDNPTPPPTRNPAFAFKEIAMSTNQQSADHPAIWRSFYESLIQALSNKDSLTVGIDGDSDTWETQRLAEFGKLTQIPSIMYTGVNAARRVMYNRCYDSGKIVVATNKLRPEYVIKRDADGNPELRDGKEVRVLSGELVRQGFDDDSYVWAIRLRHFYKPPFFHVKFNKQIPGQFGIRILKCKSVPDLVGQELWGKECCFSSLIQLAYPHVPLSDWGIKASI